MKQVTFGLKILGAWSLAVSGISIVVLCPLILDRISLSMPIDVHRASELDGSYSAASAIISAIALCVLAGSTVVQLRQARIGQLYSVRSLQIELLRMAIEEPHYRESLGASFATLNPKSWRNHAYLNLWMMYLQMNFLTATYDDDGVRRFLADEFFHGQPGVDYWRRARTAFVAEARSRRHRRFVEIVDEEHAKALRLVKSGRMRETIRKPLKSSPSQKRVAQTR